MKVAFFLLGIGQSTGGYNYFANLFSVLAEFAPGEVEPVLFLGEDASAGALARFSASPGVTIVQSAAFDTTRQWRSLFKAIVFGRDAAASAAFSAQAIELVFESATFYGRSLAIPAIAFIPDLQHRFLSHLFSFYGRSRRELGFRAQISAARTIVLSSEDSRHACVRFYSRAPGRTFVLHFAVPQAALPSSTSARAVAAKYGLPPTFVLMPNQFWRHKNHLLVIRALALLKARGTHVAVVATGKQHDSRDAAHAPAVLALADELNVADRFFALGMIPYEDIVSLMRASTALLNPSLFEGWSTSVEEARSVGLPLILSDIAVHREQAGEAATYFSPSSAADLADALATVRAVTDHEWLTRAARAQVQASGRCRRFAEDFVAIAQHAVAATHDRLGPASASR